jgi:DNA invertase Pin-like site-specific DNA recombinase
VSILDFDQKKYIIRYVAIYIRKSRAESMEDLEKHRMVLIDLCKRNNFKYVEYMEVGTSDSIDLRPKISKLLKEVEEGVYDAVCVVEYDRLGRGDLGEQDRLKKAFQKSNTLIITPDKIYDLNDDIDDTFADLKGFFARQEYKMITKRLRQGKKIGARRGQWTNGIPPLPYVYQTYKNKVNKKGLVVDDEMLPIYREIIEQAMRGVAPKKIAENLNQRGFMTPRGHYWSNVSVQRLLVDETHLGKIVSNKTQGDGHRNKRPNAKAYKQIPPCDWVIVEDCHEPVKTQDEHDRILELIHQRNIIPVASRRQKHALTGLIKCSKCGHTLTFNMSKEKVFVKPCWYIDALGAKCGNQGISVDVLESILLDELRKYNLSPVISFNEEDDNAEVNLQASIAEKEALLQKYRKALDLVNDAYELGDYTRKEWLMRKEKWQKSIDLVKNEIFGLKKKYRSQHKMSDEERQRNLLMFLDNIKSVTENSQRNELYRTIINSIVYLRERDNIQIEIDFK